MGASMTRRFGVRAVTRVSAGALIVFSIAAQATRVDSSRRICVVAVRESSLFTLCPPEKSVQLLPDGRIVVNSSIVLPLHTFPQGRPILDRSRPDWRKLAQTSPGIGPSGWLDPDLKNQVEREFHKQKGFVLAESVEDADLVFLVEGIYASFFHAGDGESEQRVLQSALAIVVPAAEYKNNPADSEALLNASLWEGASLWRRGEANAGLGSASPKALVDEFVSQKKSAAGTPPVCAAWSWAHAAGAMPDVRGIKAMPKAGGVGRPASAAKAEKGSSGDNVIRVNVELVSVPVVASDVDGRFVPDLEPGEFRLFEDGVEQKIDRVIPEAMPFHVALLLDTSNSTTFKHEQIQAAAWAFAEALRSQDRLMIVSFASFIYLDSEFTSDREQIRRAILQTKSGGGTRLYDALDLVVTDRLKQIQGRKAIVLFTDGVDSQSRLTNALSSLDTIEESDTLVYVIQYDTKKDVRNQIPNPDETYRRGFQYLHDLCVDSGGRLFSASTFPNLRWAFDQIAEELRHQYTLCYYPSNPSNDGPYRRIQVTVDRRDVKIRARAGYRAAAQSRSGK
jgi:Ca-activated chloride channel family protein